MYIYSTRLRCYRSERVAIQGMILDQMIKVQYEHPYNIYSSAGSGLESGTARPRHDTGEANQLSGLQWRFPRLTSVYTPHCNLIVRYPRNSFPCSKISQDATLAHDTILSHHTTHSFLKASNHSLRGKIFPSVITVATSCISWLSGYAW